MHTTGPVVCLWVAGAAALVAAVAVLAASRRGRRRADAVTDTEVADALESTYLRHRAWERDGAVTYLRALAHRWVRVDDVRHDADSVRVEFVDGTTVVLPADSNGIGELSAHAAQRRDVVLQAVNVTAQKISLTFRVGGTTVDVRAGDMTVL